MRPCKFCIEQKSSNLRKKPVRWLFPANLGGLPSFTCLSSSSASLSLLQAKRLLVFACLRLAAAFLLRRFSFFNALFLARFLRSSSLESVVSSPSLPLVVELELSLGLEPLRLRRERDLDTAVEDFALDLGAGESSSSRGSSCGG